MLNDFDYQNDPNKQDDSRWVHRPARDVERLRSAHGFEYQRGADLSGLAAFDCAAQKNTDDLSGAHLSIFDCKNPHVLGYVRNEAILVLGQFQRG